MSYHDLAASAERIAADIAAISMRRDPALPGWSRPVFSPWHADGRAWLRSAMEAAGLAPETDGGGNLMGRRAGGGGATGALIVGSHTDTVLGGGRFDGVAGVLVGLEVARTIGPMRHAFAVVDFLGEEPNPWGLSCLGSRSAAGSLTLEALTRADGAGRVLADAYSSEGWDPDRAVDSPWEAGMVAAYIEVHIEQATRLERAAVSLGLVTAIAGIRRLEVRISGRPDHAGTTVMEHRRDAAATASAVVLAAESLGRRGGGVATVGVVEVGPGSANVVPGAARLIVELRSDARSWLDRAESAVRAEVRAACDDRACTAVVDRVSDSAPVHMHAGLRELLREGATAMGHPPLDLLSGAGHDAAHIAALGPAAMVFVPCRDGRSHCPEEWAESTDLALAAQLLRGALQALDAEPIGLALSADPSTAHS